MWICRACKHFPCWQLMSTLFFEKAALSVVRWLIIRLLQSTTNTYHWGAQRLPCPEIRDWVTQQHAVEQLQNWFSKKFVECLIHQTTAETYVCTVCIYLPYIFTPYLLWWNLLFHNVLSGSHSFCSMEPGKVLPQGWQPAEDVGQNISRSVAVSLEGRNWVCEWRLEMEGMYRLVESKCS